MVRAIFRLSMAAVLLMLCGSVCSENVHGGAGPAHRTVLAQAEAFTRQSNEHIEAERSLLYRRSSEMALQVTFLSTLSPDVDDLSSEETVLNNTTYDKALQDLIEGYGSMDKLVAEGLDPMAHQLDTLQLQCEKADKRHQSRMMELHELQEKIDSIRSYVQTIKSQLVDDNDSTSQELLHTQLALQMNALVDVFGHTPVALSEQGSNASLVISDTERKTLLSVQEDLSNSFKHMVDTQISLETKQFNDTRKECSHNATRIRGHLRTMHNSFSSAESEISNLVQSFARAARVDVTDRMGRLARMEQANSEVRETLRGVVDAVVSYSERLAMSLCEDDCSGHGSCRSATCRCDEGWQGRTCGERFANFA